MHCLHLSPFSLRGWLYILSFLKWNLTAAIDFPLDWLLINIKIHSKFLGLPRQLFVIVSPSTSIHAHCRVSPRNSSSRRKIWFQTFKECHPIICLSIKTTSTYIIVKKVEKKFQKTEKKDLMKPKWTQYCDGQGCPLTWRTNFHQMSNLMWFLPWDNAMPNRISRC